MEAPERRLFLSYTSELEEFAIAAEEGAMRERWEVVRLDRQASERAPVDASLALIRRCDALMVLLGRRYGNVPSAEQGGDGLSSFVQLEVEAATKMGKPVFAFTLDPAADWPGEVSKGLELFRLHLEKSRFVARFRSPQDLAEKVTRTLRQFLSEPQADGPLDPVRARETLELAWLLVANFHCGPDLLLSLDPERVREGAGRAALGFTGVEAEGLLPLRGALWREGHAPNPLWMAWMTNVHSARVAELVRRLEPVRSEAAARSQSSHPGSAAPSSKKSKKDSGNRRPSEGESRSPAS